MDGTGQYEEWHGREWQEYCLTLLRARYDNHRLQEVPDRHKGDLGIEAFTYEGVCFQCYAAEEPLDTKTLYEKQRDKLTSDLGKLKSNANEFEKLCKGVRIKTYVFMVPRHDSRELVKHAQAKADEVKKWGLPFIAEDFAITIETAANYPAEREQIWAIPGQHIDDRPVEKQALEAWREAHAPSTPNSSSLRRIQGVSDRPSGLEQCYLHQH